MAARKKHDQTMSLFGASKSEPTGETAAAPEIAKPIAPQSSLAMGRQKDPEPLGVSIPVTSDVQGEASIKPAKLRLAYSRPDDDVSIEPCERGGYWIQRTRDNGTTTATVHYTRGELVQLLRRIPAALEVG